MYGSTPMSISGLRAPVMSYNPKQPLLPRPYTSKHSLQKLTKIKTQITTSVLSLPDSPSPSPPYRPSSPHHEPDLEAGLYQPSPPPSPPEERALMVGYGTMRQVSMSDELRARFEEQERVRRRERMELRNREHEFAAVGELVFRIIAVVGFSAYFVFLGWKVWEGWENW